MNRDWPPDSSDWTRRHDSVRRHKPPRHPSRPRFLFLYLLLVFGFLTLLLVGGLSALAFVVARLLPGSGETPIVAWIAALCLVILVLIAGRWQGARVYRNLAMPLADVIDAADAVAQGHLDVRVPENSPGHLRRLTVTFNRMVNELELAEQRRRNLMADVAHELRTPLHVLQGNLEGVLDGIYQPTVEQISVMLDETRQLGRLVEDLRILSLAEAGQLSLNKEPVIVAELLSDLGTSFGGLAEAGGIEFQVVCPELVSQVTLVADVGRLHQIFGNLILNALHHTPRGGSVTLLAESTADAVRFVVRDTGPGIAPEALPHIFDRYWRADREGSASGSGLGLAIARQLVELHGGTISVESNPGRGSSFTVEMPMRSADGRVSTLPA